LLIPLLANQRHSKGLCDGLRGRTFGCGFAALCKISDHRTKEGSPQKHAKTTKIQISKRLD